MVRAAARPRSHHRPAALLISKPYATAMAAGLAEFGIGSRLAPDLKLRLAERLSGLGLALLVAGELLRKVAMVRTRGPHAHAHGLPCACACAGSEPAPCGVHAAARMQPSRRAATRMARASMLTPARRAPARMAPPP